MLNYDCGRGHVTDKVYNFADVHHGYIEVTNLGRRSVSRRLYIDLPQQVRLAPEPVIDVGVPQRAAGE